MKQVRWGILGCGSIARTFASALEVTEHGVLTAVGSRDAGKAAKFAEETGAPLSFGSYEELARCPDIDAVYIATPHGRHCSDALLALNAGKHVLCEKAFCVNAAEAREMIAAAEKNGVYLCEAMWPRWMPAMEDAAAWLREGRIGEVRHVTGEYGFRLDFDKANPRLYAPDCGGGSLLDLGVYPLALAFFAYGGAKPDDIQGIGVKLPNGVDGAVSMALRFGDGTASLSCTFFATQEPRGILYGEKGSISFEGMFLRPAAAHLKTANGEEHRSYDYARSGHEYMAEAVCLDILAGRRESAKMPLLETLAVMETMDALRRQIGVVYENDK